MIDQPRKRLKWPEKNSRNLDADYLKKIPFIKEEKATDKDTTDTDGGAESETHEKLIHKKVSFSD